MNKKGISNIIVIVLLILLAIGAVVLIWGFIKSNLQNSGYQIEAALLDTTLKIQRQSVAIDDSGGKVSFVVRRETGLQNLSGVLVVLRDINEKSASARYDDSLKVYETLSVSNLNYSYYGLTKLKEITVAPRVVLSNGKEVLGKPDVYVVTGEESQEINSQINGTCIYFPKDSCKSGELFNSTENSTHYLWQCLGRNGGTNESCSLLRGATIFKLDVNILSGMGKVNSSDGINCPGNCSANYLSGTNVTLNATAFFGYSFGSWQGCDSPDSNKCVINMTSNKTLNVTFTSNLLSGLVGYWDFNSVNNKKIVPGKVGNAFNFNETQIGGFFSPRLNIFNSSSLRPKNLTVSGWVKMHNGSCTIYDSIGLDHFGYSLEVLDNTKSINVSFALSYINSSHLPYKGMRNLSLNNWYFITGTYDGSNVSIYVNGILDITRFVPNDLNYSGGDDSAIGSSGQPSNGGNPCNATIDGVRIWNRSLSSIEIANIYSNELNGGYYSAMNRVGLVGEWLFDGDSNNLFGSKIIDTSGTKNDAYTIGMPVVTPDYSNSNGAILNYGATLLGTGVNNTHALLFDGVDDLVRIPDSDLLSFGNSSKDNPFSISMWMSGNIGGISKGGIDTIPTYRYTEYAFGLVSSPISNKGLYFRIKDNDSNAEVYIKANVTNLDSSKLNHFVATYDGSGSYGGMKIYINGNSAQIILNSSSSGYVAMDNTATSLNLGQVESGKFINGTLDEVKIFNRSLTTEDVYKLYSNP